MLDTRFCLVGYPFASPSWLDCFLPYLLLLKGAESLDHVLGVRNLRSQTTESVITLYIRGLFEHHDRLWLLVLSMKKGSKARCYRFSDLLWA
jgi:hypothetical protein